MYLSEINIYPIKSLGGISLEKSVVGERGLQFDRRWMLVDEKNEFLTQREFPKMATIGVKIQENDLSVWLNNKEKLISFEPNTVDTANVKIWQSRCRAKVYESEINNWFSDILQTNCKLVLMPDDARRTVNPFYAVRKFKDVVSFADGYPFLIIGESSLDELNSRLEKPLPMNRFRPNFVVSDAVAFAEDNWKKIKIGNVVFYLVKPCDRCVITTIDQETGVSDGKEPLKTLASFRQKRQKILFGQNLIAENFGETLRVSDKVEILA